MEERIRVFEKKVEAQRFVMTNLRNGIDYLKTSCKNTGIYLSTVSTLSIVLGVIPIGGDFGGYYMGGNSG